MELLFVSSNKNWDICKEKGILGVKSKEEIRSAVYENIVKTIKAGDLILCTLKIRFQQQLGFIEQFRVIMKIIQKSGPMANMQYV